MTRIKFRVYFVIVVCALAAFTSLFKVTAQQDVAKPIKYGDTITATFPVDGTGTRYSFQGHDGDTIQIYLPQLTTNLNSRMVMVDLLDNNQVFLGNTLAQFDGIPWEYPLKFDGTYYLQVHMPGGLPPDKPFTYKLTLKLKQASVTPTGNAAPGTAFRARKSINSRG